MLIKMIVNKEQATSLYKRLQTNSKVSKFRLTEEEFLKWINTINVFNCLDAEAFSIKGISLEKYNIAGELSELIIPSKVTFDSGLQFRDIRAGYDLDRTDIDVEDIMDPIRFNLVSDLICAAFKMVNDKFVSVTEARKPKLLGDAMGRASYQGSTREMEHSFIPVELDICVLHDRYLNTSVSEMFELWSRDLILKFFR